MWVSKPMKEVSEQSQCSEAEHCGASGASKWMERATEWPVWKGAHPCVETCLNRGAAWSTRINVNWMSVNRIRKLIYFNAHVCQWIKNKKKANRISPIKCLVFISFCTHECLYSRLFQVAGISLLGGQEQRGHSGHKDIMMSNSVHDKPLT